jgi:ligand-binding sensor domain-containing protein
MVRGIDGEWTIFSEDDLGIEDHPGWMSTLIVDRNGFAWIGVSLVGIVKLLPNGDIEIIYLEPKEEFYIYDMAFDKKGQLWVGTSYGLQIINLDGEVTIYNPMDSNLLGMEVYTIDFDSKGRAWIGTDGGLNVVDGLLE